VVAVVKGGPAPQNYLLRITYDRLNAATAKKSGVAALLGSLANAAVSHFLCINRLLLEALYAKNTWPPAQKN